LPRRLGATQFLAKSDSVDRCVKKPRMGTSSGKPKGSPLYKDDDGHAINNLILLSLPRKESDRVLPHLEFVRLPLRQVIHEPGETLKSGYFCNSGIFSVLVLMPVGKSVEVGLVGPEGFSAVPLVAGFRTSNTRTVVQTQATAFRIDAAHLRSILSECPVLERQQQRSAQLLGAGGADRCMQPAERSGRAIGEMASDGAGPDPL
jgi:hypothetical protein